MKTLVEKFIVLQIQTAPSGLQPASARCFLAAMILLVCSSSQLAPRIGLYTASLVSLTDVLIGWCASDCDAPTHIVTYPNKHGEYPPSPTWRASPTWRKQKAFPLPVEKAGNSLLFSEAADSPMLADMGRETVYDFTECSIQDSCACATRYIALQNIGVPSRLQDKIWDCNQKADI